MRSNMWGHIQARCIQLRLRVTSRRELVLTGENRAFFCETFTGDTGAIVYLVTPNRAPMMPEKWFHSSQAHRTCEFIGVTYRNMRQR